MELMEWLHPEAASQEVDGRTFPAELVEDLDVATAAKMARLWHRTKAPPSRELQVIGLDSLILMCNNSRNDSFTPAGGR